MTDDLTTTYGATAGQARIEAPEKRPGSDSRQPEQPAEPSDAAPAELPAEPIDMEPVDPTLQAARRRQPGQQLSVGEG